LKQSTSTKLVCGIAIAVSLALSTPAYSNAEAGKAVYDDSCVHCHGVAGRGNPVQDQFWKLRIPRLNGEYIQNKSDAQLRNVVLNGQRKMPPALRGEPHSTNRTKVTPEQLPDLIAYIRSLKKK
jgi:mono/diheme cytochrome c family protein